jgi:CPA2 family monovalent cation:H+ antiporter-2
VLIAQDLAVVPMLIVIGGMARPDGVDLPALLLKLALAVGALALLIAALSRRQRIHLPFRQLWVRHADLAPIGALALCVIGAAASGALELSAGLGAFLAGLYVGNTTERAVMVRAMDPVQNLLLMMFFVSVGLLIDLRFVWHHIGTVLLLIGLVFLLNSVINVLALRTVGASWRVAVLAGFALAQIGEFAFVLAAAGAASGVIGADAQRTVVAVIALSMIMSPLWLALARRLQELPAAASEGLSLLWARLLRAEADALRQGSEQLVLSSAHFAARLGGRIERVTLRHRARAPGPARRPQRLR